MKAENEKILTGEAKENIEKIKTALEAGKVYTVEFSSDGSCVRFYFTYINERYNQIGSQLIILSTDEAIPLLCGYRFTQHHLNTCY